MVSTGHHPVHQGFAGEVDFAAHLVFEPEWHYADDDETICPYHDMHTGKWWWVTQVSWLLDISGYISNNYLQWELKRVTKKTNSTIIPITISSNKTQLTVFWNKTAWSTQPSATYPSIFAANPLVRGKSFSLTCPHPSLTTFPINQYIGALYLIFSIHTWASFCTYWRQLVSMGSKWQVGMAKSDTIILSLLPMLEIIQNSFSSMLLRTANVLYGLLLNWASGIPKALESFESKPTSSLPWQCFRMVPWSSCGLVKRWGSSLFNTHAGKGLPSSTFITPSHLIFSINFIRVWSGNAGVAGGLSSSTLYLSMILTVWIRLLCW